MDSETGAKRKRDLNPADFQRLLARLDPEPASASAKYSALRERLVRYCASRDEPVRAEELADDALDEIARKLETQEIQNVEQFAVGVLRMLLMASKRKTPAGTADGLDLLVSDSNLEPAIIDRLDWERKEQCFINCMKHLTSSERLLIFEYYPNENRDLEGRRRQLAKKLGVEAGTLATRMNRLRSKLERCCLHCYRRRS